MSTAALPATKHTVALFAAALSRRLSPATIRVYLAAVSLLHRRAGLSSPTRHNPSLQLALRGIQRYHQQRHRHQHKRSPITATILKHLLNFLSTTRKWNSHDRAMLKAALCLGFYGFLRGSEFTIPTLKGFDPRIHPTLADITFTRTTLRFNLKHSKTDQLSRGHTVILGKCGGRHCPVKIVKQYMHRISWHTHSPLFLFSTGKPLTLSHFRRILKKLLKHTGLSPSHFNTHSLRIGAATSAARAGIPTHTIKTLGRWRSRAYRLYIRKENTAAITAKLAAAP